MPIRHRLDRTPPPNGPELARILTEEWLHPRDAGEPLIVIEGLPGEPQHVYVIWDAWKELNQTERSEIIMDVIDDLNSSNRLPDTPDTTLITVAMGLTKDEAKRMHIEVA